MHCAWALWKTSNILGDFEHQRVLVSVEPCFKHETTNIMTELDELCINIKYDPMNRNGTIIEKYELCEKLA